MTTKSFGRRNWRGGDTSIWAWGKGVSDEALQQPSGDSERRNQQGQLALGARRLLGTASTRHVALGYRAFAPSPANGSEPRAERRRGCPNRRRSLSRSVRLRKRIRLRAAAR